MNTLPRSQLLWKDSKILKPLLLFACALCVLLNFSRPHIVPDSNTRFAVAFEIGVLIPHLFAILAPLILFAYEKDKGTLQWLRQFPTSWKTITRSHHITATVGLLILWVFSGINVTMITFLNGWPSIESSTASSPGAIALSLPHLLLSSFSWLILGFLYTRLIRSAVIASVPIVLFSFLIFASGTEGAQDAFFSQKILGIGLPSRMAWSLGALICARLLLEIILRLEAKQKDDSYQLSLILPDLIQSKTAQERRRKARRPSVWRALLWQQSRQLGPTILFWALGVLGLAVLSWLDRSNPDRFWLLDPSGLVCFTIIGTFSLGVMTFYQGNHSKNKRFLAERGLKAATIWWTRFIPTAGCFLFLLALQVVVVSIPSVFNDPSMISPKPFERILPCTLLFAAGLLISQSIERPIYAFLVTPVYWLFLFLVFDRWSPNDHLPYVVATIILLIASYRLTRPWVEGKVDLRFAAWVVGFTVIATIPWILLSLV